MYKILENKDNKTDFLSSKNITKEKTTLMFSKQEWQRFKKEVTIPSKPNKALKKLMKLDSF